jgi:hypothetical protein
MHCRCSKVPSDEFLRHFLRKKVTKENVLFLKRFPHVDTSFFHCLVYCLLYNIDTPTLGFLLFRIKLQRGRNAEEE